MKNLRFPHLLALVALVIFSTVSLIQAQIQSNQVAVPDLPPMHEGFTISGSVNAIKGNIFALDDGIGQTIVDAGPLFEQIISSLTVTAQAAQVGNQPPQPDMPLRTEDDIRSLTEGVMQKVVAGDFEAAFESLRPYWLLPAAELSNLMTTTVTQRSTIEARFGKSLGYELVRQEAVGKSLLQLIYLEKTERHALRWIFRFYKPADTWTLNRLSWDDSIGELFAE